MIPTITAEQAVKQIVDIITGKRSVLEVNGCNCIWARGPRRVRMTAEIQANIARCPIHGKNKHDRS